MQSPIVRPVDRPLAFEYYLAPSDAPTPSELELCRFLGCFLAKALVEGSIYDRSRRHGVITLGGFRMCDVFFDFLLGSLPNLQQLRQLDPAKYDGLKGLCDPTTSCEGVFFETFDGLVPDGEHIDVTDANKHEFARRKAEHLVYGCVLKQLSAVCEGFFALVPRHVLRKHAAAGLTAAELRTLLCGTKALDLDDLRRATRFERPYSDSHVVIAWLWEVMREATEAQRFQLLKARFALFLGFSFPIKRTFHLTRTPACFSTVCDRRRQRAVEWRRAPAAGRGGDHHPPLFAPHQRVSRLPGGAHVLSGAGSAAVQQQGGAALAPA